MKRPIEQNHEKNVSVEGTIDRGVRRRRGPMVIWESMDRREKTQFGRTTITLGPPILREKFDGSRTAHIITLVS